MSKRSCPSGHAVFQIHDDYSKKFDRIAVLYTADGQVERKLFAKMGERLPDVYCSTDECFMEKRGALDSFRFYESFINLDDKRLGLLLCKGYMEGQRAHVYVVVRPLMGSIRVAIPMDAKPRTHGVGIYHSREGTAHEPMGAIAMPYDRFLITQNFTRTIPRGARLLDKYFLAEKNGENYELEDEYVHLVDALIDCFSFNRPRSTSPPVSLSSSSKDVRPSRRDRDDEPSKRRREHDRRDDYRSKRSGPSSRRR